LVGFGIVFNQQGSFLHGIYCFGVTLSHHIPLTCPFLVGHVNGVSNRVLVVYLYTTGVGDGNDHTRDYTRCVVISLYGIRPLILSTCGCFMY